jgi:thiol-disulfide isomerase/thioredoxin
LYSLNLPGMKNVIILMFLIILTGLSCKTMKHVSDKNTAATPAPVTNETGKPAEINFHDPSTWILGYFSPVQLMKEPYTAWYEKGIDNYMPGSDALNKLLEKDKTGLTIKVVMGIWCPDSRREVPRFMKIMGLWQFPSDKLTFIGVDEEKQSPVGEYKSLEIQRVPTFIIYKNNIEAGRIIENPVTSLEQDIVSILNRNE